MVGGVDRLAPEKPLVLSEANTARILIVEDEPAIARHLDRKLQRFGFRSAAVASGEEALEETARDRPDLVLMDISLAGRLDGPETARLLRQQYDVPVVYLTSFSSPDMTERVKETFPLGYLTKPWDDETLQRTLTLALHAQDNHRRRLEAEEALRRNEEQLRQLNRELETRIEARTRELQDSLVEKTTLLKEIHHRVKNNLQVIISLLNLQMNSLRDKEAIGLFQESKNRIQSMALVHQHLYQSRELSNIRYDVYLRSLVNDLFASYGVTASRLRLDWQVEPLTLDIDYAVTCGLLVTELVSNALKHAFPDGRSGSLRILLREEPGACIVLSVEDDGVGLAEELDLSGAGPSLGLRIVNALCRQLNATLGITRSPGARFEIRFPLT